MTERQFLLFQKKNKKSTKRCFFIYYIKIIFFVFLHCGIIDRKMKRLSICFFLLAFYSPAVFADGDVTVSRALPASVSADAAKQSPRNTVNTVRSADSSRSVSTRTVTPSETETNIVVRSGARVVELGNSTVTSTARGTGQTINTGTVSRAVSATKVNSSRDNLEAAVNTVGRNARVDAASINNNPLVRRAGVTLRPTTAEVGGRATIGDTNIQTGSNVGNGARSVQARATVTGTDTETNAETIAQAKTRLEQTSDLNQSCQQQYNDCMDQFCAVIDANQKRCSCSANLSNYTKVENAVKDANTQLNDVAQRIRYVGLSADEIRAIMNETEAEAALSGATDTTETRNMLEEIEKMIRDPSSNTSYSADTYTGLDMSLDFTADTADIFSLDFLNTGTTSFSNLRGTDLYNAAKKRCNTVLNQCKEAGANIEQITGNYDLAIDKDCIAYEQGLTKMNETLVSNVRSANLMLQKARLAVLQNKNQYDAKGCIGALDACMTDDMVCGSDYNKCLDPTKRYIDENGEVILGQDITDITDFMQNYNNANINSGFLSNAYNISMDTATCSGDGGNNGSCNVKYLLQKIGTKQKVTDEGLCRAVLDKCQNYTYDSNGNYKPYNDVVVNYVQRAMVNIQAAQRQIISDYASNCMLDIATCYNQQVTQVNAWSTSASINSIYNVMRGACRNVALTCAYAVFANDTNSCPDNDNETCIESISQMFYQSLLCPDNSTYQTTAGVAGSDGYVNERCKCNTGYEQFGTQCLASCPAHANRNTYGTCVCESGYTMKNGVCESDTPSSGTGNGGEGA